MLQTARCPTWEGAVVEGRTEENLLEASAIGGGGGVGGGGVEWVGGGGGLGCWGL